MPWFVPVNGNALMCGLQAKSLQDLSSLSAKREFLASRLEESLKEAWGDKEQLARQIGLSLADKGVLFEGAAGVADLLSKVRSNPTLEEFLSANGMAGPYRKATEEETDSLTSAEPTDWADQFGESDLL